MKIENPTVPLSLERMGLQELDEAAIRLLTEHLSTRSDITDVLSGLVRNGMDTDDPREVHMKVGNVSVELGRHGNDFSLQFHGLSCRERNLVQVAGLIADFLRDRVFRAIRNPNENDDSYVYRLAEQAGITVPQAGYTHIAWGGHSIADMEYDFAHHVFEQLASHAPTMRIVNGSGPGIMKAVSHGSHDGSSSLSDILGVTEDGIIRSEVPNKYIRRLLVYPDIEKRMNAFLRIADSIAVFPGGAGTCEEVLTALVTLLDPNNRDVPKPHLMLVESSLQSSYFTLFFAFLREVFPGNDFDKIMKCMAYHADSPKNVGSMLHEAIKKKDPIGWNHDLTIPESVRTPFDPTFKNIEELDLTSDQPLDLLLAQLRRFYSAVVHVVIKDPTIAQTWEEKPRIRGNSRIIQALKDFFHLLNGQKRIKMSGLIKDPFEYRVA